MSAGSATRVRQSFLLIRLHHVEIFERRSALKKYVSDAVIISFPVQHKHTEAWMNALHDRVSEFENMFL